MYFGTMDLNQTESGRHQRGVEGQALYIKRPSIAMQYHFASTAHVLAFIDQLSNHLPTPRGPKATRAARECYQLG